MNTLPALSRLVLDALLTLSISPCFHLGYDQRHSGGRQDACEPASRNARQPPVHHSRADLFSIFLNLSSLTFFSVVFLIVFTKTIGIVVYNVVGVDEFDVGDIWQFYVAPGEAHGENALAGPACRHKAAGIGHSTLPRDPIPSDAASSSVLDSEV
ncbi:hypothetical protein EI94DRAFT_1708049 [Lactarius quietus]|nr:hypothetical protein EI94DRAFT_1708049 [Lactarius quietus]